LTRKAKTSSNIDYTLLRKRRIIDFLESLRGKDMTVRQMDGIMEKLFKMGEQVIPTCLSKIKEGDEEILPIVCYALQYANDTSVINPLLHILMNQKAKDSIKTRILGVLADYGVDIGQLPLDNILEDFDRVASDSMEKMLHDVEKDPFFISYILEDYDTFSRDMKYTYIKDLGDSRDPRALGLLKALAITDDPEMAAEAIRQIGRIRSGSALRMIREIYPFLSDDETIETAEREMRRFMMMGIEPDEPEPPTSLKLYKALVSSIDGLGCRAVWFAWRHPRNGRKLCSVNFLVNVTEGIKDCWAIPEISVRDFNSTLKELKKEAEVVEDYAYTISILKDALYQNHNNRTPIPAPVFFWRQFFEAKAFNPRKLTLKRVRELKSPDDESLNTGVLLDKLEFRDWFISSPRVYDYAEEYAFINKKRHLRNYPARLAKFYQRFSDELIATHRDVLKRMLELSADFLVKLEKFSEAGLVKQILEHMEKQPLYKNAFIQRMIIESVKIANANLKKGYDMRTNPELYD
jgi:hypothetical protein